VQQAFPALLQLQARSQLHRQHHSWLLHQPPRLLSPRPLRKHSQQQLCRLSDHQQQPAAVQRLSQVRLLSLLLLLLLLRARRGRQ
jgi:hypothetical protein